MDFWDVVNTQRAMRRLKPDPVPDELLWKLLETATKAPSGGNVQSWNFVVVTGAEDKRKIGEWYLEAWRQMYGPAREAMLADARRASAYKSADHLAHHIAEVPVLIFATVRTDRFNTGPVLGASLYPAVQNLLLAARALGLGATLTTLHMLHQADVRALLGIPDDAEPLAMIPVGWPKGTFGPPIRLPAEKVVYWERWGARRERPTPDR